MPSSRKPTTPSRKPGTQPLKPPAGVAIDSLEEITPGPPMSPGQANLLETLLVSAVARLNAPDGFLYTTTPGKEGPVLRAGVGTFASPAERTSNRAGGILDRVFQSGEPLLWARTARRSGGSAGFKNAHFVAAVPVKMGTDVAGVMGVARRAGAQPFSPADLEALNNLAGFASVALENERLAELAREQQLQRQKAEEGLRALSEELALLHETALGLVNRLDVSSLLETIVTRAEALVGTPDGFLYVLEPEANQMVMKVGTGFFETVVGKRLDPGQGLVGAVWKSGQPLSIDDYQAWPSHMPERERVRAAVGIPLSSGKDVVGVICLAHTEEGRTFAPQEMALLMRFGQLASLALENARLYAAVQQELIERRTLEEQLLHQAFHDSLTDLPNRAMFVNRMERALLRPGRRRSDSVAVLFLDLDDFKVINDSLGHKVGDQLLIAVGNRIQTCLRAGDTIARLGGDEFTVLLEGISDLSEATDVAGRVAEQLQAPFCLEDHDIFISTSIGVAFGSPNRDQPTDLLKNADVAMYEAKRNGKARYAVFEPRMNLRAWARLQLEADLRRAIERREFVLHYQPVVDLATGKVVEVEALLRWQKPGHGIVPPMEFIPVAEEAGLILLIGRWVLEEACREAHSWNRKNHGHPPITVSVNLSGRQFKQPDLVESISRILTQTGLDPSLLRLEITESVALDNSDATLSALNELCSLGVHIAIDDFGTGYSALSYLKRYPVDTLKLDRTFVDGLGQSAENNALVGAVVSFARAMNMRVTAEGIETEQQLAHLRMLGCEYGQGYYFARPVPAAELAELLARDSLVPTLESDSTVEESVSA